MKGFTNRNRSTINSNLSGLFVTPEGKIIDPAKEYYLQMKKAEDYFKKLNEGPRIDPPGNKSENE